MIAEDMLHAVLMAEPGYDREERTHEAARSALLALVSALAYADDTPRRLEYVESLIELHNGEQDPLTAAIVTAAGWLQSARTEGDE